jgi:hypothetical protein
VLLQLGVAADGVDEAVVSGIFRDIWIQQMNKETSNEPDKRDNIHYCESHCERQSLMDPWWSEMFLCGTKA